MDGNPLRDVNPYEPPPILAELADEPPRYRFQFGCLEFFMACFLAAVFLFAAITALVTLQ